MTGTDSRSCAANQCHEVVSETLIIIRDHDRRPAVGLCSEHADRLRAEGCWERNGHRFRVDRPRRTRPDGRRGRSGLAEDSWLPRRPPTSRAKPPPRPLHQRPPKGLRSRCPAVPLYKRHGRTTPRMQGSHGTGDQLGSYALGEPEAGERLGERSEQRRLSSGELSGGVPAFRSNSDRATRRTCRSRMICSMRLFP